MNSEPTFLYGLHDAGGEHLFREAGVHGWIVFNEFIGLDGADRSGVDYSSWSDQGYGIIVKLQHAFNPGGTLPRQDQYPEFAARCAHFAAASQGCQVWVIGNEMNYWTSRPDANARSRLPLLGKTQDPAEIHAVLRALPERFEALDAQSDPRPLLTLGRPITPDLYASCYRQCRQAILAAQPDAKVLVGAVTPWNTQTRYAGNEIGDWVTYLNDLLLRLGPQGCDGIALHAFTVDGGTGSVTEDAWLAGDFAHRRTGFRVYRDFMQGIPYNMRHLPVYIVEADPYQDWSGDSTQWIQAVYREIDQWNSRAGRQQIRCVALYRWARTPGDDRWRMEHRAGTVQDLRDALGERLQWNPERVPLPNPTGDENGTSLAPGMVVQTLATVNLRAIPGFIGVAGDALGPGLPLHHQCLIADGPVLTDSLVWWRVHTLDAEQRRVDGWLAQAGPDGNPLLERITGAPDLAEPFEPVPIHDDESLSPGTYFVLLKDTVLRHTPGELGKDASDVVMQVPASSAGLVLDGPQFVEDAIWWQVRCAYPAEETSVGWLRERVETEHRNIQVIAVPGTPALPETKFRVGERVFVARATYLRRLPGEEAQAADAIIMQLAPGLALSLEEGPKYQDGRIWWRITTDAEIQPVLGGWIADTSPTGYDLIASVPPSLPERDDGGFALGAEVYVVAPSEVWRMPGDSADPDYGVLATIPRNTLSKILGGVVTKAGRLWWPVAAIASARERIWGWVAQTNERGEFQLAVDPLPVETAPVARRAPSPRERTAYAPGDRIMNVSPHVVRLRATPGNIGKPSEDILARVPSRSSLIVTDGPREKDGLRWWQASLDYPESNQPPGWIADGTQGGLRILAHDFLADHIRVAKPFAGNFPMSQAWGSNASFYSRFSYSGVTLKGHNGFDFAIPVGTPLLAVDAGTVARLGFYSGGFGKFVLMEHDWGESVYAHMDDIQVSLHQTIPRGGLLGLSGNTGASTGPHLHLGIRVIPYRRTDGWGGFCNPAPFMNVNEIFRSRPVAMPPSAIGEDNPANPLP